MPSAIRDDAAWSSLPNPDNVPIRLMATEQVAVQPAALRQALAIARRVPVRELVLTPDLHPGDGIPVGAVVDTVGALVPGLIGTDIGCGMRLLALDLPADDISGHEDALAERLRAIFFGGERDLALTADERERLVRVDGEPLFAPFRRWIERSASHDDQLGSVGGGNHFVELGRVDRLADGPTAWSWGLRRDRLTVLVHTGSLGFGRAVAAAFADPRDPLAPLAEPEPYLSAMRQAANFATGNRRALGAMAVRAVAETLGVDVEATLVGDAAHNLIRALEDGSFRHRKGATPAAAGAPVLIPGSMGDASWVLAGTGDARALESTSHGAGRALRRGAAARTDNGDLRRLRVVTPVDPRRVRRDVRERLEARLREEAPGAYKPVEPVIESVVAAGAARRVARLRPLLTVKGA